MTTKREKEEAIEQLRSYFKGVRSQKALTVYTTVNTVSRSGMSRTMSVRIIRGGETLNITWLVAKACGYSMTDHNGLRIGGCGMDMGFALVYDLSHVLFAGTARHKRLRKDRKDGHRPTSAGYILSQRWLQ
jgi:hypothetical protein